MSTNPHETTTPLTHEAGKLAGRGEEAERWLAALKAEYPTCSGDGERDLAGVLDEVVRRLGLSSQFAAMLRAGAKGGG